jgi:hypothetical protein
MTQQNVAVVWQVLGEDFVERQCGQAGSVGLEWRKRIK